MSDRLDWGDLMWEDEPEKSEQQPKKADDSKIRYAPAQVQSAEANRQRTAGDSSRSFKRDDVVTAVRKQVINSLQNPEVQKPQNIIVKTPPSPSIKSPEDYIDDFFSTPLIKGQKPVEEADLPDITDSIEPITSAPVRTKRSTEIIPSHQRRRDTAPVIFDEDFFKIPEENNKQSEEPTTNYDELGVPILSEPPKRFRR